MKSSTLLMAALTALLASAASAQDHSEHRGNTPVETSRAKETNTTAGEHADHQAVQTEKPSSADKESFRSEERHIPPDPPEHIMSDMSEKRMMELMDMDDTSNVGRLLIDELEGFEESGHTAVAWDAQAWYGSDYHKIWIKTEGERTDGALEEAEAEALWSRVVARWWSLQAGVRHDFGEGPSRTWAAIGMEGLAPYWFDVEATLYVGGENRVAARLKANYELLFTQRLILQPEVELNLLSKEDRERNLGAGLTDIEVGLRLRYEFRREIAPYVGMSFTRRFGDTADFLRAAGEDSSDVRVVAGVRVWF